MKKTVLHITHGIYPNNGFETFLKNLINNLPEYNHVVTVFPKKNNDIGLNAEIIEIEHISDIKDIIDEKKAKLVFTHWTGAESLNPNSYIAEYKNKRFLVSDDPDSLDNDPFGYINIPFMYETYINTGNFIEVPSFGKNPRTRKYPERIVNPKKITFIMVCHSEYKLPQTISQPFYDLIISVSKKAYYKQSHINAQHKVIYNGISLTNKSIDNLLENKLIFHYDLSDKLRIRALFLGRLEKYSLDIYESIKSNKEVNRLYDFIYVGSGKLDNSPLPNHYFLGEMDHDKLDKVFSISDLFLYPTNADSFGLSLLEAMSYGLPVIASEEVKEIVNIGVTDNYICEKPEEYIRDLIDFAKQTKLDKKYLAEASLRRSKDFSLEKMVYEYESIIKGFLDK